MNFEFTKEHKMLRVTIRKFLEKELIPIVEEIDEKEHFPREVYKKLGEMGFIGSHLPVEYGGSGGDFVGKCLLSEEISKVSAGFEMSMDLSGVIYANPINQFGTEEQKQKYLPPVLGGDKMGAWALTEPNAGSDVLSIRTTARREGEYFIINGSKTFITNAPIADYFVIQTRTSGKGIEGGTAFIKIAPENPILWTGMKGASAESRKNKSDAETSSA